MAATTRVYTLALVAEKLGEDQDWLWEISCKMNPEDGCLGIIGLNDEYTVAFTEAGIEYLARFVEIHKPTPAACSRCTWTAEPEDRAGCADGPKRRAGYDRTRTLGSCEDHVK